MNTALLEEALAIPPGDRVSLAEALLASIDEEKEDVKLAWQDEVKYRMQSVAEGHAKLYDVEKLFGS